MITGNLETTSHRSDAHRQPKNMTETANPTLDMDLEFLNLKEVAGILRVAPISVYRLIAKRAIPVYRTCRKILFKKRDVLDYLERSRKDAGYGGSKD